jgi:hypothetical protein
MKMPPTERCSMLDHEVRYSLPQHYFHEGNGSVAQWGDVDRRKLFPSRRSSLKTEAPANLCFERGGPTVVKKHLPVLAQ